MANKYSPLSSQYRSTIHFTLNGLVSNYTVKQFKVHKVTCNEDNIENKLNREFNSCHNVKFELYKLRHFRQYLDSNFEIYFKSP